jgi:hypothetical protein
MPKSVPIHKLIFGAFYTRHRTPTSPQLAAQGILLTNYNGVTHPSEPNYVASIAGDFFGMGDDSE